MRLVKIKLDRDVITLEVLLAEEPTDRLKEDVSIAATEIIADFPSASRINEVIRTSIAPLPEEDLISEGWVYQRAE